MRPLKLTLQAFGSYPGKHEVDFEALRKRGLFLVTGPTGSGKTTVFDAMVYALYGRLPGTRGGQGEPRSHHAAPGVETEVEFEFAARDKRYRVRRTPAWSRPAQRGSGMVTQPATATLVQLLGDATESIAQQVGRVTAECENLVGLDAQQFQRVVLLPQGQFGEFLMANEADRQSLLSELFGGELYERATQKLRERLKQLNDRVFAIDTEIDHHRANAVTELGKTLAEWLPDSPLPGEASDDALASCAETLEPLRATRLEALEQLREAALVSERSATQAKAQAQRFDDAAKLRGEIDALALQHPGIQASEQAAAASRKARPVVLAADVLAREERRVEAAKHGHAKLLAQLAEGFERMGEALPQPVVFANIAPALAALGARCTQQRETLLAASEASTNAMAAVARHQQAVQAQAQASERAATARTALTALESELETLRPHASRLGEERQLLEKAREVLQQRKTLETARGKHPVMVQNESQAKDHAFKIMAGFIATQAPRLAAQLIDGEPCAVCGSRTHPAKAEAHGEVLVGHEAVDAAQAAHRDARAALDVLEGQIEAATRALGEAAAAAPLAAAAEVVKEREAALAAVQKAAEQLRQLEAALPIRREASATADKREQDAQLEAALAEERAKQAQQDAARLLETCAGIDETRLARCEETLAALGNADARLNEAEKEIFTAGELLAASQEALAKVLADSGFAQEAAARAALLDLPDETAGLERAAEWRDQQTKARVRLEQLEQQGIPELRPEAEALEELAGQARQRADDAARRHTTASNALGAAQEALQTMRRIAAGSEALRAERDDAAIAFKLCNGEAGARVKLERWVLAAELERVASAANVHLARLSKGRYRLVREQGKGALGLQVFDANTGRARATASLSGGEQFQASLALALGLADVVSLGGTASGHRFEALFVDEGFGSLDPRALDDAIEALIMIQAGGRLVGAITHVEAMKQHLHVGIEVLPNADGRGSGLVVNP